MSEFTSRPFDEDELIAQIGRMNIFAISGGRVGVIRENNETVEIKLPVSNGYRVSIKRDWNDIWIVSCFFVLNRQVANYISGDDMPFENDPLVKLSSEGQLKAFKHNGFWSPVDSLREKQDLEVLWNNGKPPWTMN